MTTATVPLRPGATDLAQFADDMAQLGPFTAKELATQYLDQNIANGYEAEFSSFDEAVAAFTPSCRYYV